MAFNIDSIVDKRRIFISFVFFKKSLFDATESLEMVSNGEKTSMKQNPREVVARLSQECSRKGLFVGSAGSVSVKEG